MRLRIFASALCCLSYPTIAGVVNEAPNPSINIKYPDSGDMRIGPQIELTRRNSDKHRSGDSVGSPQSQLSSPTLSATSAVEKSTDSSRASLNSMADSYKDRQRRRVHFRDDGKLVTAIYGTPTNDDTTALAAATTTGAENDDHTDKNVNGVELNSSADAKIGSQLSDRDYFYQPSSVLHAEQRKREQLSMQHQIYRILRKRAEKYLIPVTVHTGISIYQRIEVRIVDAYANGEPATVLRYLISRFNGENNDGKGGDEERSRAFIDACARGYSALAVMLREKQGRTASINRQKEQDLAIYLASKNGHVEMVRLLLGWGIASAQGALQGAIYGDQLSVLWAIHLEPELMNEWDGETLLRAAELGRLNILKWLLGTGLVSKRSLIKAIQVAYRCQQSAASNLLLDALNAPTYTNGVLEK